jgi:hypothetical protein
MKTLSIPSSTPLDVPIQTLLASPPVSPTIIDNSAATVNRLAFLLPDTLMFMYNQHSKNFPLAAEWRMDGAGPEQSRKPHWAVIAIIQPLADLHQNKNDLGS